MELVNLQVRVPAELRDGLRVAAAMRRMTMAALVERTLRDAGYAEMPTLPREANAGLRRAAVEGDDATA